MKKRLALLLSAVMTVSTLSNVFGANGIIKNGRTLVPVRGVFEDLGFAVNWDSVNNSAKISNEDYTIIINKGEVSFNVNSKKITPDVPQQIINGRFYIPLRAISDAINADISWEQKTKAAHIKYNNKDVYVLCDNSIALTTESPVQGVSLKDYTACRNILLDAKIYSPNKVREATDYLYSQRLEEVKTKLKNLQLGSNDARRYVDIWIDIIDKCNLATKAVADEALIAAENNVDKYTENPGKFNSPYDNKMYEIYSAFYGLLDYSGTIENLKATVEGYVEKYVKSSGIEFDSSDNENDIFNNRAVLDTYEKALKNISELKSTKDNDKLIADIKSSFNVIMNIADDYNKKNIVKKLNNIVYLYDEIKYSELEAKELSELIDKDSPVDVELNEIIYEDIAYLKNKFNIVSLNEITSSLTKHNTEVKNKLEEFKNKFKVEIEEAQNLEIKK